MAETPTCAKCAATDAHLATIMAANEKLSADHDKLLADHTKLLAGHQELSGQHAALTAQLKSFQDWAAEEAEEHGDGEDALTATLTAAHGKDIPAPAMLAGLSAKRKALRTFQQDIATLTGEKTGAAMLGKATAWKSEAGELATLKGALEVSKKEKLTADFKAVADKAVADGKMSPAVRKVFEAHAETRGIEFAMECLTAHVGATTAPIVNRTETIPPSQETSAALATLTAGTRDELAKLFPGLTAEEAAKQFTAWQKSLPHVMAARAET